jgi:long-subunit fatty acid transport protein
MIRSGNMKKLIFAVSIVPALFLALGAGAGEISQRIKFASSPNPVGSGGRAVAWGGAFIAIADDATAASWNPAGLIQLETPEVSAVLSYEYRDDKLDFDEWDVEDQDNTVSHGEFNYISAAYPFNLFDRNFVASINYQRLFEFNLDLDLELGGVRDTVYGEEHFTHEARYEQIGALTTLSPAMAVQITPEFSLGLTLNFWGLDQSADGWKQQIEVEHTSYFPGLNAHQYVYTYQEEEYKLSGMNANIGILWTPGRTTIGAVYKTSFKGDLDYSTEFETSAFSPEDPSLTSPVFSDSQDDDEKITWPAAYGIGVGYRYSDAFSLAFDLYRTEWSRFIVEDDDGNKYNLIAGRAKGKKDNVQDTMQFRAGCEYLFILEKIALALRGGVFYDQAPGDDDINKFYGLGIGTGIVYKSFVTDIAYQYRLAFDVESQEILGESSEADVNEHFLIASLIYHF